MGQTFSDELQKELETLEKPKVTLIEINFKQKELASLLNMDTKNHYNIAFVGASGVGKSSLINAVRGLRNQVKNGLFAQVGETECTHKPAKYVYPGHEHIVLWDIPGGETVRHKAETYFYDHSLDAFDFLIIVVGGGNLSEFDTKIAKHAKRDGVPFALVKSKFDQSIANRIRRTRRTCVETKAELLSDFKNSFSKDLKRFQLTSEIFIVSEVGFDVQDDNFVAYRNDELKLMKMALTISEDRRRNRSQSQSRSTDQHVPMARILALIRDYYSMLDVESKETLAIECQKIFDGSADVQCFAEFTLPNEQISVESEIPINESETSGDDRMVIQNVLAGMDQQQLMELLNWVSYGELGSVDTPSTSGTTSAAATTTAASSSSTVAATATQPSITAAAPASIAASNAPRPVASAAGAGKKPIQVADLRNILLSMSVPAATSQADSDIQSVAEILENEHS